MVDQPGGGVGAHLGSDRGTHSRSGTHAGFIVVFAGDIMTMPALPPQPNAWRIDLDAAGHITGMH